MFREELFDRQLRQLDAEDAMTLRGQPRHVIRLAGKGYEHACVGGQVEPGPVLEQQGRGGVLVEADLIVLPALVSEVGVHGLSDSYGD